MATGDVIILREKLAELADDHPHLADRIAEIEALTHRGSYKQGHARPRRIGLAKMTPELKARIREAMAVQTADESDQDLAERFGTTAARISELRGSIPGA